MSPFKRRNTIRAGSLDASLLKDARVRIREKGRALQRKLIAKELGRDVGAWAKAKLAHDSGKTQSSNPMQRKLRASLSRKYGDVAPTFFRIAELHISRPKEIEDAPSREVLGLLERMVAERERKYLRELSLPHSLLHFHLVSWFQVESDRAVVGEPGASVCSRARDLCHSSLAGHCAIPSTQDSRRPVSRDLTLLDVNARSSSWRCLMSRCSELEMRSRRGSLRSYSLSLF